MNVVLDQSLETINNYESVELKVTDEGVIIVLDYLSDNWDDIQNDRQKDLVYELEAYLQKLQSKKCFGRHPVRYSNDDRPGFGQDLTHVVVSIVLASKEELDQEGEELMRRLRSEENVFSIPDHELAGLNSKLNQQRKQKKSLSAMNKPKYRWTL